ncbi:MAG: methyltransferase family protein [Candidatus Saccharimonadales bacterium]
MNIGKEEGCYTKDMFPFSRVITLCWIIFWIYWLISSFSSKRNTKSNLRHFAGIRVAIFVVAIILFRFLNVQNSSSINRLATHSEWVLTVGFIIFLLGLIVAIWARISLGKNWGMPMTLKQKPELVTSGPYAYVRHPIYSGILLAVFGCVISSSLFWLIIFAFAGTYFIYSAVVEERLMTKQFPGVYPDYSRRTKMLVPFIF